MATLNGLPVFDFFIDDSDESNEGISFISLVDFPAIEVNWVALSDEKKFYFDKDRQILYGPILIPNQPIYRYSKQMGEFWGRFPASEIEKMIRKFQKQKNTVNLNYQHKKDTQIKEAVVQELWLTGKNDKSKDLGFDLPEGSAMVGVYIGDSKFWAEEVLTKNVMGFSIEAMLDMMITELKSINQNMQKEKFVSATTVDGVVVKTDAEAIVVGVEVYTEDEAGNKTPAPDGTHTLDNGMVIVVSEGKVTEVSEVEEEMDAEVEKVLEKAFNKFFASAIKTYEAKLAEMEVKFSNQPAGQPATKKDDAQPVEMSKMEKVKQIILKSKTK